MVIAGVVFFVISAILIVVRVMTQKKLFEIQSTETLTAKDLQDLYSSVKSEVGQGGFSKMTEVKGVVKCDNPLNSELANQPCVYYSMTVVREFEETREEKDSSGNYRPVTHRGSETISSNTQSVPFYVEDETGKILVNPNDAGIDSQKVLDKFESGEYASGPTLSFGGWTLNVGGITAGRRTLGYRFQESIVPLGRKIYVLGEATDTSGELAVQKPREKGKKFIISMKSEEELVSGAKSTIKWTLYGAIACDAIAVVLIILGLLGKK
jgi:hypothetical protein